MRAVIQRVREASVDVDGTVVGRIGRGLLVFLGIGTEDGAGQVAWMIDKLLHLRIFANEAGKLDASVVDVGAAVMVVSQFTLYAETRKGRRPSFTAAAPPERADTLYRQVADGIASRGVPVARGQFGARMAVALVNDGPLTILLDSHGS